MVLLFFFSFFQEEKGDLNEKMNEGGGKGVFVFVFEFEF